MKFSFGQNWREFATHALSNETVARARSDFESLFSDCPLAGKTFLDVGFGQGLALFLAEEKGAAVLGIDRDLGTRAVLALTGRFFPGLPIPDHRIVSILDDEALHSELGSRVFDVVHAWGALHHTGDMWKAMENAAAYVSPGGTFVLAIYNRHWSCGMWKMVKAVFFHSPALIQRALITLFYPLIFAAVWWKTGRDPNDSPRGMDLYFDVIDWLGGFPYEYASQEEVIGFMRGKGFDRLKVIPAFVPTGNNQYVFRRMAPS
jgi:SAM-dependent methyltransferase